MTDQPVNILNLQIPNETIDPIYVHSTLTCAICHGLALGTPYSVNIQSVLDRAEINGSQTITDIINQLNAMYETDAADTDGYDVEWRSEIIFKCIAAKFPSCYEKEFIYQRLIASNTALIAITDSTKYCNKDILRILLKGK